MKITHEGKGRPSEEKIPIVVVYKKPTGKKYYMLVTELITAAIPPISLGIPSPSALVCTVPVKVRLSCFILNIFLVVCPCWVVVFVGSAQ